MYEHKRVPPSQVDRLKSYGWQYVATIDGLALLTRKKLTRTVTPAIPFKYVQDFPVNCAQL